MGRHPSTIARDRQLTLRRQKRLERRAGHERDRLAYHLQRIAAAEGDVARRRQTRRVSVLGNAILDAARQQQPRLLARALARLATVTLSPRDRARIAPAVVADLLRRDAHHAHHAAEALAIRRQTTRLAFLVGTIVLGDVAMLTTALRMLDVRLHRPRDRALFDLNEPAV